MALDLGSLFVKLGARTEGLKDGERALSRLGSTGAAAAAKLTAGLAASFAAIGTAAFASANQVDKALNTIRAGTGATGGALQALGEDFRAVFATIPASAQDAATAIADLNTRTGQTGEGLRQLSAQMLEVSRLTGTDIATNVAAVTRVFGDWSLATAEQGAALDFLFKTSQTTGIQLDSLAQKIVQYGAPLRQFGFGFEEAAVLMGKWEREGVNTELVLGSLRIAIGQFAREQIPLREGLEATIQQIQELGPGAEAAALAMEVFGARAGPDMAAAILEGRLAFADLLTTIQQSPETILRASEEARSFGEIVQLLRNQVTLALEPLGQVLIEAFNRMVPAIEGAIQVLADWSRESAALIRNAAGLVRVIEGVAIAFETIRSGPTAAASLAPIFDQLVTDMRGFATELEHAGQRNATFNARVAELSGLIQKAGAESKIGGIFLRELADTYREGADAGVRFSAENTQLLESLGVIGTAAPRAATGVSAVAGELRNIGTETGEAANALADFRASLTDQLALLRLEADLLRHVAERTFTLQEAQAQLEAAHLRQQGATEDQIATNQELHASIQASKEEIEAQAQAAEEAAQRWEAYQQQQQATRDAISDQLTELGRQTEELEIQAQEIQRGIAAGLTWEQVQHNIAEASIRSKEATGEYTQELANTERGMLAASERVGQLTAAFDQTAQSTLHLGDEVARGMRGVVEGILLGTREAADVLEAFADIGVSIFADMFARTIQEKLAWEVTLGNNLLTALPNLFSGGALAASGAFISGLSQAAGPAAIAGALFGGSTGGAIGSAVGTLANVAFTGLGEAIVASVFPALGSTLAAGIGNVLLPGVGLALGFGLEALFGEIFGGLFAHTPTLGTQIRKSTVAFLKDIEVSFADEVESKEYFFGPTKKLAEDLGIGFLEASKIILENEVGPELARQLSALGTFITADSAQELGKSLEQTGTTFGNLLVDNLGIEAIPGAIDEIVAKAGISFDTLVTKLSNVLSEGIIGVDFYTNALQGAVDIFFGDLPIAIDTTRIVNEQLAQSFLDATHAAGIAGPEVTRLFRAIQDGALTAEEAVRRLNEQGFMLDISDIAVDPAALTAEIETIAENLGLAGTSAAEAFVNGLRQGLSVEEATAALRDFIAQALLEAKIAELVEELFVPIFEDLDFSKPLALDSALLAEIEERFGAAYENAVLILETLGLWPEEIAETNEEVEKTNRELEKTNEILTETVDTISDLGDEVKSDLDQINAFINSLDEAGKQLVNDILNAAAAFGGIQPFTAENLQQVFTETKAIADALQADLESAIRQAMAAFQSGDAQQGIAILTQGFQTALTNAVVSALFDATIQQAILPIIQPLINGFAVAAQALIAGEITAQQFAAELVGIHAQIPEIMALIVPIMEEAARIAAEMADEIAAAVGASGAVTIGTPVPVSTGGTGGGGGGGGGGAPPETEVAEPVEDFTQALLQAVDAVESFAASVEESDSLAQQLAEHAAAVAQLEAELNQTFRDVIRSGQVTRDLLREYAEALEQLNAAAAAGEAAIVEDFLGGVEDFIAAGQGSNQALTDITSEYQHLTAEIEANAAVLSEYTDVTRLLADVTESAVLQLLRLKDEVLEPILDALADFQGGDFRALPDILADISQAANLEELEALRDEALDAILGRYELERDLLEAQMDQIDQLIDLHDQLRELHIERLEEEQERLEALLDIHADLQDAQEDLRDLQEDLQQLQADRLKEEVNGLEELLGLQTELIDLQIQARQEELRAVEEQLRAITEARQGVKQLLDAAISLRDAANQALISPQSFLTPQQQLAEAQGQFLETAARARGGDVTAAGELPGLAQTLNEIARQAFASGQPAQDIFQLTQEVLRDVSADLEAQGLAQEATLDTQERGLLAQQHQLEQQIAQLEVQKGIRSTAEEIAATQAEIAALTKDLGLTGKESRTHLQTMIDQLNRQVRTLEHTQTTEQEIATTQAEIAATQREIARLTQEVGDTTQVELENMVAALEQQIETLENTQSIDEQIAATQQEIATLTKELGLTGHESVTELQAIRDAIPGQIGALEHGVVAALQALESAVAGQFDKLIAAEDAHLADLLDGIDDTVSDIPGTVVPPIEEQTKVIIDLGNKQIDSLVEMIVILKGIQAFLEAPLSQKFAILEALQQGLLDHITVTLPLDYTPIVDQLPPRLVDHLQSKLPNIPINIGQGRNVEVHSPRMERELQGLRQEMTGLKQQVAQQSLNTTLQVFVDDEKTMERTFRQNLLTDSRNGIYVINLRGAEKN